MPDTFTTATWADLINEAVADIGALQPGQSISVSAQNDGFLRLGQLIDSWSGDPLLALGQVQHGLFTFTPGVFNYTLGPSGTFATSASPVRITGGSCFSGNFRQPMRLLAIDEFAVEAANPQGLQATLPRLLAADTAFPNINLKVHEPPLTAASFEVHYWPGLTQPTALGSLVNYSTAFQRALVKNLAVSIYPQYARERGIDPALVKEAMDSLEFIRDINRGMLASGTPPPPAPQPQQRE